MVISPVCVGWSSRAREVHSPSSWLTASGGVARLLSNGSLSGWSRDGNISILKSMNTAAMGCIGVNAGTGESPMNEHGLNESQQNGVEDFYWAREAPEVQQHQGKLVVVHNKRVVA